MFLFLFLPSKTDDLKRCCKRFFFSRIMFFWLMIKCCKLCEEFVIWSVCIIRILEELVDFVIFCCNVMYCYIKLIHDWDTIIGRVYNLHEEILNTTVSFFRWNGDMLHSVNAFTGLTVQVSYWWKVLINVLSRHNFGQVFNFLSCFPLSVS